jgi:hypothetical protein
MNRSPSNASENVVRFCCAIYLACHCISLADAAETDRRELASPVIEGRWLRPAAESPAVPRWGHAEGLQVGISPLPGPRGLMRIYTPYLGQPEPVMINFIAIEPIPRGEQERGLSELEQSRLDGVRGKRFWSADNLDDRAPRPATEPARGRVVEVDGVECLQVFILVEPFDNGADVTMRLTFRADRPHEVGIATFANETSIDLEHCIVTATMGNYARLRELHLADRVVSSKELWPDYRGNDFAPHQHFPLRELSRTPEGEVMIAATPDEAEPQSASYAPGVRRHWRYQGRQARQTWRVADPHPELEALVNGRRIYWASRSPIPGGISFENFELVAPFKQGGEFWFGVEPEE